MRLLQYFLVYLLTVAAWPAHARDNVPENVQIMRDVQQKDAKTLIAENLKLTDSQAAAFWPVYDRYDAERSKIENRIDAVIQDYKLTCERSPCDPKAGQLLNEWMSARHDLEALRQSYIAQFGSVLPPTKVLRLYQIEGLREAVISVDRFKAVPLAK
jgi:Spy/CpxP family protein refolding chaperone